MKCTVKKTRTSPSFGPFSIFVGLHRPWLAAVGLRELSWISCTFRKNTLKKQTYLWPKRHIWRRLGPFPSLWASFSLFVSLRWLLWAFVGIHGCRPRQRGGVVGVVQPTKLYSKKRHSHRRM